MTSGRAVRERGSDGLAEEGLDLGGAKGLMEVWVAGGSEGRVR